jgi:hypothetical protein
MQTEQLQQPVDMETTLNHRRADCTLPFFDHITLQIAVSPSSTYSAVSRVISKNVENRRQSIVRAQAFASS